MIYIFLASKHDTNPIHIERCQKAALAGVAAHGEWLPSRLAHTMPMVHPQHQETEKGMEARKWEKGGGIPICILSSAKRFGPKIHRVEYKCFQSHAHYFHNHLPTLP